MEEGETSVAAYVFVHGIIYYNSILECSWSDGAVDCCVIEKNSMANRRWTVRKMY